VAVVFPTDGVKMWEWSKGIWQELRGIKRSGVTAMKFIHEGAALLGATSDGVMYVSCAQFYIALTYPQLVL
jgi:hypothetical protein